MTQIILIPSVLGARRGITDLADTLRSAGHTVSLADVLEGETFEDYPSGLARSQEIGDAAQQECALEAAKGAPGPFVAIGFSVGGATAQWLAAQLPDRARGVVMVGGGVPMRFLEATWPPGVAGQVHVTAEDPFHEEDKQFDDEVQDDVEHAGGEFTFVEYQGAGHLFTDPTFSEYQPEEARIFTRRVLEFVDEVGRLG